jgi:hypothetical protein
MKKKKRLMKQIAEILKKSDYGLYLFFAVETAIEQAKMRR